MTRVDVSAALHYDVLAPTSFLFHVAAQSTAHQSIEHERLVVEPETDHDLRQVDAEGNRLCRVLANPGGFTIRYDATVSVSRPPAWSEALEEHPHIELPVDVLPYLTPSRYCESDRLLQLALTEFGDLWPGVNRVQAICDWISEHITYEPGATNELTTACDVLIQRAGVCRDYSHLAIALCRALCIPARYVSAYAVDLAPPDFHGLLEVYLGSDWYLFDPSRKVPVDKVVRIGVGRDAADAAFATIVGSAYLNGITVEAHERASAEDDT